MIRIEPARRGRSMRRVIVCDLEGCNPGKIARRIATTGVTAEGIDRTLDTCPRCSERLLGPQDEAS